MKVTGKSKSVGFTLIELLIVIAIIAVVSAMSFAILPKIMRRAKGSEAMQNMRQISPLLMSYAGDHQMKLPPAKGTVTLADGTTSELQWNVTCLTLLFPDTDVATLMTPNWWKTNNKTIMKNPLYKASTAFKPGFAFNLMLPGNIATAKGEPVPATPETVEIPFAALSEPSRIPLVVSCTEYTYKYNTAAEIAGFKNGALKELAVDEKIPVLFADGHTETMTPTEYVNRKLYELPRP
ncbi:MAG TPA: type II secretion system protein [Luteolibacter sp.]